MAKQGAADIANFFSSFLEGYQTARGLKIAEEDRQRKIEREDFIFNQQLEAAERQEAARDKIKEIYSMTSHSDEHKQKYLQTLEAASKGINVPTTASGSYRAPEPTNLLIDPNYLKFTNSSIKGALGELLALDPNANTTQIQKYIDSNDVNRSTMIVTGISSVLYSNESMEEKSKMLKPLLAGMTNDKSIDVSVQSFTVENPNFNPNALESETNSKTKVVEKFVIKNDDGSINRTLGMEDLGSITDAVGFFAKATEDFSLFNQTAKAMEKEKLTTEAAESTIEKNQLDNALKALELKNYPKLFEATIAEKLGTSSKDEKERIKTFNNNVSDVLSTNVSSAASDWSKSKKKIGGDDGDVIVIPQFIQGGKSQETQYQRDTVLSVVNSIETKLLEELGVNLIDSFGDDFSQANVNYALKNKPQKGAIKNIFNGITDALFDESETKLTDFFLDNFKEIPSASDPKVGSGFFIYIGSGTESQQTKTMQQNLILNKQIIEDLINNNKTAIRNAKS